MHVRIDELGDAARQEVPDDDAAVVAADGQQRAALVEGAGDGDADTVQRPVEVLSRHNTTATLNRYSEHVHVANISPAVTKNFVLCS